MVVKILVGAATVVVIAQILLISQGVYLIGDTTNYLEHALQGGLLTTFIKHVDTWPPATAMFLNVLLWVFKRPLVALPAYVLLLSGLSLAGMIFLIRRFVNSWQTAWVVAVVVLLVGPQHLIFSAAIAELLFITVWIWSLYSGWRFLKSRQIGWLWLFIVLSSILPLSKYIGIGLLLGVQILFLFLLLRTTKKKSSCNWWLVTTTLVIAWIPVALYLFRTKVQIGSFFGARDPQFLTSPLEITLETIKTLVVTFGLSIMTALGLGLTGLTKNKLLAPILLIGGSTLIYLGFHVWSLSQYLAFDNFPHRYLSPVVPLLGLTAFLVAAQWKKRLVFLTQKRRAIAIVQFLVLTSVGLQAPQTFLEYQGEMKTTISSVAEVESTQNIQLLCESSQPQYLLMEPLSRNWVAQGVRYLCPNVTQLLENQTYQLPAKAILLTPNESFKLENAIVLAPHLGPKTLRRWQTTESVTIDVAKITGKLSE